ncbi:MAG TPA: serine hydrolase [Pyrinomonadaceae bacterium]|jgi:CubicO group peptidase (beta-lactamase class C family)|nr:serine hydrolase [Pyrinomonadaceae bacterium]
MKILQIRYVFALFCILLINIGVANAQEKPASEKVAAIDTLMQTLVKRGQFNGAVLAEDNGKVIYSKGFGYADFEKKTPVDADSVFEIASISKTFTSMAVMILVEQGKIKYDDDIKKYFPGLPYKGITIRHLLTHTSGLPEYMDLFYAKNNGWDKTIKTNADLIALLKSDKPPVQFGPGERWLYNNTGFCLLASIVEKVSGKPFAEFLRVNIFKPLGMKNTRIHTRLSKEPILHLAAGYLRPSLLADDFVLPEKLDNTAFVITLGGIVGDGSVHSTVGDLLKWGKSFSTEKLIKNKTIEEAFTPVTLKDGSAARTYENSRGLESGYGFGWFVRKGANDSRTVWHTGGWPGYVTFYSLNPARRQTVVVLSNADSTAVPRAGQAIEKILNGQTFEMPRLSIARALAATVNSEGAEKAAKLYRELKQNKPAEYIFSQGELNRLGYELLERQKFADAIAIFTLNVEEYPQAGDPYDSLGEAHMKNGERELAIKNYERSLELDPKNQNAVNMLKKLKEQKTDY